MKPTPTKILSHYKKKKHPHPVSFSLDLINLQNNDQDYIMKLDIADQWEVKFATKETNYHRLQSSSRCYEHPRSSMVWLAPLPPPDVLHCIFSYSVTKENHKTSKTHQRFKFAFFLRSPTTLNSS